ncbi:MAG: Uma2 family endonuclease [Candidatus Bipolaricaulia bacterium]
MAQRADVPTKLTYAEFLEWCDEDTWAEWVDGEVALLTPASDRHQDLARFLTVVISAFVERHDAGTLRPAPFQMKLGPELSGREPDLLFVVRDRERLLNETFLDGPADLVVEIISPESRLRDRGEKFAEYEMAGVREYWLIDPEQERADFFVLGNDDRYERQRPDDEGLYRSTVLAGFWIDVSWLWSEPLPPVIDTLQRLGLI